MKNFSPNKKLIIAALAMLGLGFSACNNRGSTVQNYSNDGNGNVASTARGQELFQAKCAACHGIDGSARNNNAANLQINRIDSISIIHTIQNGKGTMPPFKDAMPDSDMAALAVYVKSLRH
jgi:mono/diheme cytochrome c family protein